MIKRTLSQSFLITMITALLVGLSVPKFGVLAAFGTIFLQIIFFLSCLKIEPRVILDHLKDWKFLLLANFVALIGLPLIVWTLSIPWQSDFAFALFLLAAMPVGMTTPLLVEVAGGKQSIAMMLTVITSLLAPITIPIMAKILYGAHISIAIGPMFLKLVLIIFVPFTLAMVAKSILPKAVESIRSLSKFISVGLMGLITAGVIANQSAAILEQSSRGWVFVLMLVALYVFFLGTHIVGYFVFWWKSSEVKQTTSISMTYANGLLAIVLANQFFPRPEIVVPLVLSIIPFATFMPIWLWITRRKYKQQEN